MSDSIRHVIEKAISQDLLGVSQGIHEERHIAVVEARGLEPLTSALQRQRSTS